MPGFVMFYFYEHIFLGRVQHLPPLYIILCGAPLPFIFTVNFHRGWDKIRSPWAWPFGSLWVIEYGRGERMADLSLGLKSRCVFLVAGSSSIAMAMCLDSLLQGWRHV